MLVPGLESTFHLPQTRSYARFSPRMLWEPTIRLCRFSVRFVAERADEPSDDAPWSRIHILNMSAD